MKKLAILLIFALVAGCIIIPANDPFFGKYQDRQERPAEAP